ncbi:MAG: hypothetical protein ACTSWK_01900 [Promethearchaeota archaeon]
MIERKPIIIITIGDSLPPICLENLDSPLSDMRCILKHMKGLTMTFNGLV